MRNGKLHDSEIEQRSHPISYAKGTTISFLYLFKKVDSRKKMGESKIKLASTLLKGSSRLASFRLKQREQEKKILK